MIKKHLRITETIQSFQLYEKKALLLSAQFITRLDWCKYFVNKKQFLVEKINKMVFDHFSTPYKLCKAHFNSMTVAAAHYFSSQFNDSMQTWMCQTTIELRSPPNTCTLFLCYKTCYFFLQMEFYIIYVSAHINMLPTNSTFWSIPFFLLIALGLRRMKCHSFAFLSQL